MKKITVRIRRAVLEEVCVPVRAASNEEAIEKAKELVESGEHLAWDYVGEPEETYRVTKP